MFKHEIKENRLMYIGQFIYSKYKGRGLIHPDNFKTIGHNYDTIYWYGNPSSVKVEKKMEYKHEDEDGKYNIRTGGCINKLKTDNVFTNERGTKYIKVYKKQTWTAIPHDYFDGCTTKKGDYPTQKPYKLLERIICLSTI
jgi:DNA modification methylase